MLAKFGRRNADCNRRILEMDRRANDTYALYRAVAFNHHTVDFRLFVGERLREAMHRRAQQVLLFESRNPVGSRVAFEALAKDIVQCRFVLDLQRVRLKARILLDRR